MYLGAHLPSTGSCCSLGRCSWGLQLQVRHTALRLESVVSGLTSQAASSQESFLDQLWQWALLQQRVKQNSRYVLLGAVGTFVVVQMSCMRLLQVSHSEPMSCIGQAGTTASKLVLEVLTHIQLAS